MKKNDIDNKPEIIEEENDDKPISIIAEFKMDDTDKIHKSEIMPLLPLRNMVLFPTTILPVKSCA